MLYDVQCLTPLTPGIRVMRVVYGVAQNFKNWLPIVYASKSENWLKIHYSPHYASTMNYTDLDRLHFTPSILFVFYVSSFSLSPLSSFTFERYIRLVIPASWSCSFWVSKCSYESYEDFSALRLDVFLFPPISSSIALYPGQAFHPGYPLFIKV